MYHHNHQYSATLLSKVLLFALLVTALIVTTLALTLPTGSRVVPHSFSPSTRSNTGPVIFTNFQDPCLILPSGGKTWYAFSGPNGNPANINVQIAQSSDLKSWSVTADYDVLPIVGTWAANPPHVWSPDVNQLPDGSFIMYYAASSATQLDKHCIGSAKSKTIAGPYTPSNVPLFCNLTAGGAIDADGFVDPTTKNVYVVYKIDGNSIGTGGACRNSVEPLARTPIMIQQVNPSDGVTKIGDAVALLTNEGEDGPTVEAPALFYSAVAKLYILVYNSGCFVEDKYAVRYATSPHLLGPYMRQPDPLIKTGDTAADVQVPGAVDMSSDGSVFVFHGDLNDSRKVGSRVRGMYVAELEVGASGQLTLGALL